MPKGQATSTATELHARTRFAPSPTGMQHIGGYRTALFSWLLARHTGGQFILRIEDTDIARTEAGAVEAVIAGFKWLGMDIDEGPENGGPYGPYYQTQRRDIYAPYAEQLIESGSAYRCFCTRERLAQKKQEQMARHLPPRYDRTCRNLPKKEIARNLSQGQSFTVRLASPLAGQTVVHDALRPKEPIVFDNANLDDPVILKSDGYPTYHLAAMVDDHLMGVTHVLRAEEWIPSAPLHVIIYQALGWEPPVFAHVPDVLAPVGAPGGGKLSKRKGALPLLEYRDRGYLPEAVLNYMALLGWSYDDKETILSRDQLIAAFTLDRVGIAPSRHDESRLLWFNGYYIRQLSLDGLLAHALPFLERPEPEGGLPDSVTRPVDADYARRVLALEQERMKTFAEAPGMTSFFFLAKVTYPTETLIAKHMDAATTLDGLRRALSILEGLKSWVAADMEAPLRDLVTEMGLKPVQLFTSIRVAVTGRTVSPPLFETMETLGRDMSLERLRAAIHALETGAAAV